MISHLELSLSLAEEIAPGQAVANNSTGFQAESQKESGTRVEKSHCHHNNERTELPDCFH